MAYTEYGEAYLYKKTIEHLYESMSSNKRKNNRIMKRNKKFLINSSYILNYCATNHDETKSLWGIEAALNNGADPNYIKFGDNYLFNALDYNKSEEFVLKALELGIKHNINLNHRDSDDNTIFLKILKKSYFTDDILNVYQLLKDNGYEILSVNEKNHGVEYLINNSNKEYKNKDEFLKIYKQDKEKILNKIITTEELIDKYLEKNKKYENVLTELAIKITKDNIDEDYKLRLISKIIKCGFNVNQYIGFRPNIIFLTLFETNFSYNYIYSLLVLCIENGLDVNVWVPDLKTILHYLILSDRYTDKIIPIYELLMNNGYDDSKKDKYGFTIYSLVLNNNVKFADKEEFINRYCLKETNNLNNLDKINKEDKEYLELYGSFINDNNTKAYYKKFNLRAPHNNTGVKRLFIENKPILLLTGKEGVGLNESLMYSGEEEYRKYGTVIYHTSVDEIIKNCKTISSLKPTFINILRKCAKNNIIVFIYDIDKVYNNFNNEDIEELNNYIEYMVENKKLIIKGTIHSDKQKIFNNSNLKDMIDYVTFHEPTQQQITNILNFEIKKYNLVINDILKEFLNKIIYILIRDENRLNNKVVSNRKIISDLVKNIYEYLAINKDIEININSIIYSLNNLENVKKEVINEIIKEINIKTQDKVLKKLVKSK